MCVVDIIVLEKWLKKYEIQLSNILKLGKLGIEPKYFTFVKSEYDEWETRSSIGKK